MRNLLSVSDDISAKVLFIIEEDGRDAGSLYHVEYGCNHRTRAFSGIS